MDLMRFKINHTNPSGPGVGDYLNCRITLLVSGTQAATLPNLSGGTASSALTVPISTGETLFTIAASASTFNANNKYFAFYMARPGCYYTTYGPYQFNSGTSLSVSTSMPGCLTDRLIVSGYIQSLATNVVNCKTLFDRWTVTGYTSYCANHSGYPYARRDWSVTFPFSMYSGATDNTRYISFKNINAGTGSIASNYVGPTSDRTYLLTGYYYMTNSGQTPSQRITNSLPFNSAFTGYIKAVTVTKVGSTPTELFSSSTSVTVARGSTGIVSGVYKQCFSKGIAITVYTTNLGNFPTTVKITCTITHTDSKNGSSQTTTLTEAGDGTHQYVTLPDWIPTRDTLVRAIAITLSGV